MIAIKQSDTYRRWERKLRDPRTKALIAARIVRLSNGLAGDVKPVGQGISELRIHHGPGYRPLHFHQYLRDWSYIQMLPMGPVARHCR